MKRVASASLLFLCLLGCTTTRSNDLPGRIDRILAAHPQQTIAVAYQELDRDASLFRNEREVFHAASTMKVPVMVGVFHAAARGVLSFDAPFTVRNEFTSIYDGSTYALEAREDSDAELYDKVGQGVPIEELVRRMIVRSSNLATNNLMALAQTTAIPVLMKEIGANDIKVLRGVEDDKAYHAGMNNTTTAYDLLLIFKAIAQHNVVSAEASEKMIAILLAQEHNDGIPAGLPSGTRVAHKTGSITEIAHDGGIVIAADGTRYALVVLTRGFKKHADAERVIAEISRAVWESRS
ncbi:MAG TPA: serine hydrolase [Thermoanaerobaculia bacterium]|nr:serine hydrolase [Thermoanaerobaculia bacterium]